MATAVGAVCSLAAVMVHIVNVCECKGQKRCSSLPLTYDFVFS